MFKEGNLDREIYIENLYVNKQGCSEFILFHEEVIFIILQFISLTFFFSVSMDISTISIKEIEAV